MKNEIGTIDINKYCYKDIAQIAALKVKGVEGGTDKNFVDIKVSNNDIKLNIEIKVDREKDVIKTSKLVQDKVREAILEMMGIEVKEINVEIVGFIK